MTMFNFTNGALVLALLSLLNPIPIGLLYLNSKPKARLKESIRDGITICLASTAIMLVIIVIGTSILGFLGVNLLAIRIAGGVVLTLSVYRLISQDPAPDNNANQDQPTSVITPFVTPICVGGASISLLFSFISAIPQRSLDAIISLGSAVFISFAVIGAFLPIAVIAFKRIPQGVTEVIRSLSLFITFSVGITILLGAIPDVVKLAGGS